MNMKMEIICDDFQHKKIIDNKIIVSEKSEEYYVVPLTKSFSMESDDEVIKLTFENQLLWLKYSNHKKEILVKEFDFEECVLIKAEYIHDIYIEMQTNNYLRKNVWFSDNSVSLNKRYGDKYLLVLPIIEDMIDIKEFGVAGNFNQIHMITNEVLLKKTTKRGKSGCNMVITNNCLLNKDALFITLNAGEVASFVE